MIFFTAKLTRGRAAAMVVALGLILCALILLAGRRDAAAAVNAPAGGDKQLLGYIAALGWQVDPEPTERRDVVIPREFDDVYSRYNELQLAAGFDLSKYAGRQAEHLCYVVRNHPSGEDPVYLCLLVYNGAVIGGDLHSAALDGFMHPLAARGDLFPE